MKQELLSITDENAILITAEFLISGHRLKIGKVGIQRYEIDLIVKRDITCDQLLSAIREGLRLKLKALKVSEADLNDYTSVFVDSRIEDSKENDQKSSTSDVADGETKKRISRKFRTYLSRRKQAKIDSKASEIKSADLYSSEGEHIVKNSEEDYSPDFQNREEQSAEEIKKTEIENYLICWHVFNECYEAYLDNALTDPVKQEKYKNHVPVIGIGATNIPNTGTHIGTSDQSQNQLRQRRDNKIAGQPSFNHPPLTLEDQNP